MNCLPRVTESLNKAIDLLRRSETSVWVERLLPLGEQLVDSQVIADPGFTQTVINEILSYFGTQGSLNDVWVSDFLLRKQIHAALSELFMWCLIWDRDSTIAEAVYRQLCAEWKNTSKDPLLRSGVDWQTYSK